MSWGDFSYETTSLIGKDVEIYARSLKRTGFQPSGRAVVLPDVENWEESVRPFICAASTVPSRIKDAAPFFIGVQDALFIYGSGQMMLIDHHDRLLWSISKRLKRATS